jgi:hypothetical protein
VTEQDPTGLSILTDDELRTHVRIMLEGTGHRGPQSWPLDNLDEDIYREIERRAPACAELRRRLDALLDADMERRLAADPTTPEVGDYADVGQEWADPQAEREYEAVRERWRERMTAWVEGR